MGYRPRRALEPAAGSLEKVLMSAPGQKKRFDWSESRVVLRTRFFEEPTESPDQSDMTPVYKHAVLDASKD